MKKQKMVMTTSLLFMLISLVFMAVNVAAAISHTVNIGSTVSFKAIGKVSATITVTDSESSAVTVQKNSTSHSTNGTLTISPSDASSTGDFSFGGDIDLSADDSANGTISYWYNIAITNNYLDTDSATYKILKVTFTAPASQNGLVSVEYDDAYSWTDGSGTKIVTIAPNSTADIKVVFTTDVTISNTADMGCSFVLEADMPNIWDGSTASNFAGGNGTEANPYQISNGAELALMSYLVNNHNTATSYGSVTPCGDDVVFGYAYYRQTADINLNDGEVINSSGALNSGSWNAWTPIGTRDNKFEGLFDGSNFKISGVYINNSNAYQGLFGYLSSSEIFYPTIKNVGLINSYIQGGDYVGGICGRAHSNFIINCYNASTVIGNDNVGGIVGENGYMLWDCYNTGKVTGANNVGGVVGNSDYGTAANCYNAGSITGTDYVGGIIGYDGDGGTANCYNIGTISSSDNSSLDNWGPIIGTFGTSYSVEDCYYLDKGYTDFTRGFCFNTDQIIITGNYEAEEVDSNRVGQTLITLLNSWVTTENSRENPAHIYKTWTLTGSTTGYPIFAS